MLLRSSFEEHGTYDSLRKEFELFWAVCDHFISFIYVYSPSHESKLRSQVSFTLAVPLTHTPLSPFTSSSLFPAYLLLLFDYLIALAGLRPPLSAAIKSICRGPAQSDTFECARVRLRWHLLSQAPAVVGVGPLRSPVRSIASWVCQHRNLC